MTLSAKVLSQIPVNRNAVVNLLTDSSSYPALSKELLLYGRGNALLQLLDAISKYDGVISTDKHGYQSFMLPVRKLAAEYGGAPNTWGKRIEQYCRLGLLMRYKPENHSASSNTPEQNYSISKAEELTKRKGRKYHPATWYTLPTYTPERLTEANDRAGAIYRIPAGKDAARDALKDKDKTNRAYDITYDIHPETQQRRDKLRKAAISRLDAEGYFYPEDVYRDVYNAIVGETEDIFDTDGYNDIRRLKDTWTQYRPELIRAEGLTQPHKPTQAERAQYQLTSQKYIVTRRQ